MTFTESNTVFLVVETGFYIIGVLHFTGFSESELSIAGSFVAIETFTRGRIFCRLIADFGLADKTGTARTLSVRIFVQPRFAFLSGIIASVVVVATGIASSVGVGVSASVVGIPVYEKFSFRTRFRASVVIISVDVRFSFRVGI